MTHDEILEIFKKTGALLEGHFQLTSGLHSPHYFQCARVLQELEPVGVAERADGEGGREPRREAGENGGVEAVRERVRHRPSPA